MKWTTRCAICDRCRATKHRLRMTTRSANRRSSRLNCLGAPKMTKPAITVIDNGELYAPLPLGRQRILIDGEAILAITPEDSLEVVRALRKSGFEIDAFDASDCIVVPGFIDPHAHLIGAGGEQGFLTRQP